jgi:hypothetical protein
VLALSNPKWYNIHMNNTIRITQQGGVQYTFSNGYTLSIGCGVGHYSSNENKGDSYGECTDVEVAIMNPAGGFVALEMDVASVSASIIPSLFRAVEAKDWEHIALLCGQDVYDHAENRRDLDPTSDQSQAGGYYAELDQYA